MDQAVSGQSSPGNGVAAKACEQAKAPLAVPVVFTSTWRETAMRTRIRRGIWAGHACADVMRARRRRWPRSAEAGATALDDEVGYAIISARSATARLRYRADPCRRSPASGRRQGCRRGVVPSGSPVEARDRHQDRRPDRAPGAGEIFSGAVTLPGRCEVGQD